MGHNGPYASPVGRMGPVGHPEKQGGRMLSRGENIPVHGPRSSLLQICGIRPSVQLPFVLRPEVRLFFSPSPLSVAAQKASLLAGQQA